MFRIRICLKKGRPDPDPHGKMRILIRNRIIIDADPKPCLPVFRHVCSPADGVPVEREGLRGDEGTDGDDQGDVEDRRADHSAHTDVVL